MRIFSLDNVKIQTNIPTRWYFYSCLGYIYINITYIFPKHNYIVVDKETKEYLDFINELQLKCSEMQLKFNKLSDNNKQRFWNSPLVQSMRTKTLIEALKYLFEHRY